MPKKVKKVSRRALLKNYDRAVLGLEKVWTNKIKKLLDDQADRIGNTIKAHVLSKKDNEKITKGEAEKIAEKLVVLYKFKKDFKIFFKVFTQMWLQSGELGNQQFNIVQFGTEATDENGLLFAIIRKDYLTWLETYGGQKIVKINDTTRYITQRLIRNGLIHGDSMEDIAKSLSKNIKDYNLNRARTIASTEIHNSYMKANHDSATANGFKYKTWLSSGDSHVRPAHQALNGMTIKISEDFLPGLAFPGDPRASSALVIRCRCILTYKDEEE